MPKRELSFDPRAILAGLERNYVDYVLIGGLARVVRGTDEVTTGVDICPSFARDNLARLGRAIDELEGRGPDRKRFVVDEATIDADAAVSVSTVAGTLQIVASPAGAPRGFVDLRRAATKEHLGPGLQPLVASTGDLARLAAALHREEDVQRLPELRRIIELEADRERLLTPTPSQPAPHRSPRRGPHVTR